MAEVNVLTCELETARKIFWLLMKDHIFLGGYNSDSESHDGGVYPAINTNDLFVAGADAEPLGAEDLDLFIESVKRYPVAGAEAWCAVKRNAKPWRQPTNLPWMEKYDIAVAGISDMLTTRDAAIQEPTE